MVTTRADLEELGFHGFVPFVALSASDVPEAAGVYAVVREGDAPPVFVPVGTGRAPYPVLALEAAWVVGAAVLYFGKATFNRLEEGEYGALFHANRRTEASRVASVNVKSCPTWWLPAAGTSDATAIPSRRLDLPDPFSPTKNVIGWLNETVPRLFMAGTQNGYSSPCRRN